MTTGISSIHEVNCGTWDKFICYLRTISPSQQTLFRGQRDQNWPLKSAWDRWVRDSTGHEPVIPGHSPSLGWADEKAIQSQFLRRFKNLAIGLPGLQVASLKEDELWALGRHHGLTTPLLDWTESPYVAAYFAFVDLVKYLNPGYSSGTRLPRFTKTEEPVAIWMFQHDPSDPLPELRLIQSRVDTAYRQKAQRGLFTRIVGPSHDGSRDGPPNPEYRDLQAYLSPRGQAKLLTKVKIAGTAMEVAILDLARMNISASTMFPDLNGAAEEVNTYPFFQGIGGNVPPPFE